MTIGAFISRCLVAAIDLTAQENGDFVRLGDISNLAGNLADFKGHVSTGFQRNLLQVVTNVEQLS